MPPLALEYVASGAALTRKGRAGLSQVVPFTLRSAANPFGTKPSSILDTPLYTTGAGAGGHTYPTEHVYGTQFLGSGQVLENKIVHGRVSMSGSVAPRITNCVIVGGAAFTGSQFLISTSGVADGVRAIIEFCTVRPENPGLHTSGIGAKNYYAYRCDVSGTVDCFGSFPNAGGMPTNVLIEGCIGHRMSRYTPHPGHSDNMTHNDVIQVQGGYGCTISGSFFSSYTDLTIGQPISTPNGQVNSAAIMMSPNVGTTIADFEFSWGWIGGGQFAVNSGHAFGNMKLQNIIFDRGAKLHADGNTVAISIKSTQDRTGVFSNFYEDGVAVVIRNG